MSARPVWDRLDRVLLLAAAATELPGQPVEHAWSTLAFELDRPGALERFAGARADLIGLIHRTARTAGANGDLAARLSGGHRRIWVANQLQLHALGPALDALTHEGVRHLVSGELAIVGRLADLGARPVRRLRILVSASEHAHTRARLVGAGWELGRQIPGAYRIEPDAEQFNHPAGASLMLASTPAEDFKDLWARRESSELAGLPPIAYPARDVLLASMLGSSDGWLAPRALLRLLDTALLGARATEDEWQRSALRLARAHEIATARYHLDLLSAALPSAVPAHARRRLDAERGTMTDRLAHRFDRAAPSLASHLRHTAGSGAVNILRSLPASLRRSWNLSSTGQVPRVAFRRVAERIGGRSGSSG